MVGTVFSDFIVKASELRRNQKRWLDEAHRNPITVSYGRRQLAIINREQVRGLYMEKHYLELVLRAFQELTEGSKSDTFPWVEHLSDEERKQFQKELLACVTRAVIAGDWSQMENLIQDWKATAETEQIPEIVRALQDEERRSEYVTLE